MDRHLILSSHTVRDKNGNKPSDFIIKYINPIILNPNRQYEIGLDRIISMSFTWFNVTKELNNQKIRYSSDSGTNWTELILRASFCKYRKPGASCEIFNFFIFCLNKPFTELFSKMQLKVPKAL